MCLTWWDFIDFIFYSMNILLYCCLENSSCIAYNLHVIRLRGLMWEKLSVLGPTTPLITTMPEQTRLTGFLSPVASSTGPCSQSLPCGQVSPAPAGASQPVTESESPLPDLPTRAGRKSKKTVRAEKKEKRKREKRQSAQNRKHGHLIMLLAPLWDPLIIQ